MRGEVWSSKSISVTISFCDGGTWTPNREKLRGQISKLQTALRQLREDGNSATESCSQVVRGVSADESRCRKLHLTVNLAAIVRLRCGRATQAKGGTAANSRLRSRVGSNTYVLSSFYVSYFKLFN